MGRLCFQEYAILPRHAQKRECMHALKKHVTLGPVTCRRMAICVTTFLCGVIVFRSGVQWHPCLAVKVCVRIRL